MRVLYKILFLIMVFQPVVTKAEISVICAKDEDQFVLLISNTEMRIPSMYGGYDIIEEDEYAFYAKIFRLRQYGCIF